MRGWTPDLAVGVAEIDNQHKALLVKINALLEAMNKGAASGEVLRLAAFLGQHVVDHFWTEEKYMARCGYPGIDQHKHQHDGLIRDFMGLKDQLAAEGVTPELVLAVHGRATDWLVNHICKVDKPLGEFLRGRKAA